MLGQQAYEDSCQRCHGDPTAGNPSWRGDNAGIDFDSINGNGYKKRGNDGGNRVKMDLDKFIDRWMPTGNQNNNATATEAENITAYLTSVVGGDWKWCPGDTWPPEATQTSNSNLSQRADNVPADAHPDILKYRDDIKLGDIENAPKGNSWKDSYSVGDQCFCDTNGFDHGIGGKMVDTPSGRKTVRQACAMIGNGPGAAGNPIYNDIQCGNGPANNAPDETYCPGRVDLKGNKAKDGCRHIGPTWNFAKAMT